MPRATDWLFEADLRDAQHQTIGHAVSDEDLADLERQVRRLARLEFGSLPQVHAQIYAGGEVWECWKIDNEFSNTNI